MNSRRMLGFTRRMLLQFRHDRRTLGFVIGMPLLMMLAFGYTFGGEVSHVKVDIVDQDAGLDPSTPRPWLPEGLADLDASHRVIGRLDSTTLDMTSYSDWNESRAKVDRNEAWAAIRFPRNFTEAFLNSSIAMPDSVPARIEIYIDGSSPNIASTVLKAVTNAYLLALQDIAKQMNQSARKVPIEPQVSYAYGGGDTKFIDYFAPAIMSMAIMMVTTMLTIILFVYERRSGTLQRLLVSPATPAEIVFGYALAFAVLGVLQSIVILFAAMLIFNITIVGNIAVALLVILLLAFVHQGLGILLSASARNELQAIQFIPLVLFPSILLAGMFWPVESIPQFLQPVSYCVPLRYGIDAMRSIMLRGWGLERIWPQVLALVLMACLTLGGAVLQLRRRK